MLKECLKKYLLCPLLPCLIYAISIKSYCQTNEVKKYSWCAFSVGVDYLNVNYANLKSNNPYLLGLPHNNIYLPSLKYYVGNLDKVFGEAHFSGIWNLKSGNYQAYKNISVSSSNFNWEALISCKVFNWNKENIYLKTGIANSRTQIISKDIDKGTVDTITMFENSVIKQLLWSANLFFDLRRTKTKRGEISFGINVGYNFPLSKSKWYLPGSKIQITDSKPEIGLNGFTIGLYIQFWSYKNKTKEAN